MEERAKSGETQSVARDRYNLLLKAVDNCNNENKMRKALDYFFRVHENKETPPLSYEQVYPLLREIAAETINRDYIKYVLEGTWGDSGMEMIRILYE